MKEENLGSKIKYGLKNINIFTKIYNNLCRSCKAKAFRAINKKDKFENNNNRMENVMKNLCKTCNKRVNDIIARSKK